MHATDLRIHEQPPLLLQSQLLYTITTHVFSVSKSTRIMEHAIQRILQGCRPTVDVDVLGKRVVNRKGNVVPCIVGQCHAASVVVR